MLQPLLSQCYSAGCIRLRPHGRWMQMPCPRSMPHCNDALLGGGVPQAQPRRLAGPGLPHRHGRPRDPRLCLPAHSSRGAQAFLLESVEGGEHVGRYTFIGIQPYKKMVSRGTSITIQEGRKRTAFTGDIFEELKKALSGHTPARLPGLPPFTAGAVGFFAYDVVRQIEKLPSIAADELGVPDACLMFFDQVLAFDHVKKEIHLIVTADLAREPKTGAYQRSVRRLDKLEKRLAQSLPKTKKKKPQGKLQLTAIPPRPPFPKIRRKDQGVRSRRRRLPVRPLAALRLHPRCRRLRRLPRATHHQPVALHVFPPLRPRIRIEVYEE